MASPENPFTVTYSKPGVKPPVYLAGTFSNPPWLPQQMQSTRTADDEYLFSLEVQVVAGREYEIKFRIGEGNWWVYDEDKPVGTTNRRIPFPCALSLLVN